MSNIIELHRHLRRCATCGRRNHLTLMLNIGGIWYCDQNCRDNIGKGKP